jgi:copper transport protein
LAAFVIALLLGVAPAQTAFAHASLIAAEPADGAVVASPPERLILVFNEPISPLVLRLIDPEGQVSVLTDVVQHDATLVVLVPPRLRQGTHVLSWRVVSADGHPVGGTIIFSVGQADAAPPQVGETTSDATVRMAIWLARFALYAAFFVGAGGAVFMNCIAAARVLPGHAEKIIVASLFAGLVLLPLSVGLQGLDALGVPLSWLARSGPWAAGFATAYGTTVLIAFAALLMALFGMMARPAAFARLLSLMGVIGIGLALAASGHASAATPQWLMRPTVFVHGLGVAFWVGSFYPLVTLFRAEAAASRQALRRFSNVIPWAVAGLVGSGGVLALVQLGRIDALWTTSYGWVFLAKMAVVAVLFSLGAVNRFLLTPQVEAGDARAGRKLRLSILIELCLAFVILGIVATWRFTPPPRAIDAAASAPEFIHFHIGIAMADVTLDPGRVGRSSGKIMVLDANFQPIMPKGVALIFSQPANGIEPIRRDAVYAGEYVWRIDNLVIPTPGRWRLRIEVLLNDFEKLTLEDDILVRPES